MQKIHLCVLVVIGVLLMAPIAMAVDAEETQVVSGHVIQADAVGNTLVIAYIDPVSNTLTNMTLSVPESTVVVGGEQHLGLEDIQVSDRVEVEFTGDPVGNPVAKRIVDMDRTNASD